MIDEIAEEDGVRWEYSLHAFMLWLERRRQKETFESFDEAIEAWRCESKKEGF